VKACEERREREQKTMPEELRVPLDLSILPELPQEDDDFEAYKAYNDAAEEANTASMPRCPNCSRSFFTDRLIKHLKICTTKKDPKKEARKPSRHLDLRPKSDRPVTSRDRKASAAPNRGTAVGRRLSLMSTNTLRTLKGYADKMEVYEKCVADAQASLTQLLGVRGAMSNAADAQASLEPLNIMNDELCSIKIQLCEMQGSKISNLIDELDSGKARAMERRNKLVARSEKLEVKLNNFLGLLERKIERCESRGHTAAQQRRASIVAGELQQEEQEGSYGAADGAGGEWQEGEGQQGEWQELQDDDGNVYYYNQATAESAWELPAAVAVANGKAVGGNWEELVDPVSGAVYYWDSVTNETSWEVPAEVVQANAAATALTAAPAPAPAGSVGWIERAKQQAKQQAKEQAKEAEEAKVKEAAEAAARKKMAAAKAEKEAAEAEAQERYFAKKEAEEEARMQEEAAAEMRAKRLSEKKKKALERKIAEEELDRKIAEEEAERKTAEDEAESKLAEQEAERKMWETEAERKTAEEEAERKTAEQEAERKMAEEKAERKMAEEEALEETLRAAASSKREAADAAEASREAAELLKTHAETASRMQQEESAMEAKEEEEQQKEEEVVAEAPSTRHAQSLGEAVAARAEAKSSGSPVAGASRKKKNQRISIEAQSEYKNPLGAFAAAHTAPPTQDASTELARRRAMKSNRLNELNGGPAGAAMGAPNAAGGVLGAALAAGPGVVQSRRPGQAMKLFRVKAGEAPPAVSLQAASDAAGSEEQVRNRKQLNKDQRSNKDQFGGVAMKLFRAKKAEKAVQAAYAAGAAAALEIAAEVEVEEQQWRLQTEQAGGALGDEDGILDSPAYRDTAAPADRKPLNSLLRPAGDGSGGGGGGGGGRSTLLNRKPAAALDHALPKPVVVPIQPISDKPASAGTANLMGAVQLPAMVLLLLGVLYLVGMRRVLSVGQIVLPLRIIWYYAANRLVITTARVRMACRDVPLSLHGANILMEKLAAWAWKKSGGRTIGSLRLQLDDEPELGYLLAAHFVLLFVAPQLLSTWSIASSVVMAALIARTNPTNQWHIVAATAAALVMVVSTRGALYEWRTAPSLGSTSSYLRPCFATCGNSFIHKPPKWMAADAAASAMNDKLYCDHQWLLGVEPPWPIGFCRPVAQACTATLPTQYTVRIPLKAFGFQMLQYIGVQDLWWQSYLGLQYLEVRNVDNDRIGVLQERLLTRLLWDDILVNVDGCESLLYRTRFFKWLGLPPKRFLTVPNPMAGERQFETWGAAGVGRFIPLMPSYTSRVMEGGVTKEYGVDQGSYITRFSSASGSYTARRTGDKGLNWVVYRHDVGGTSAGGRASVDAQVVSIYTQYTLTMHSLCTH
jgi:hypothetical protein